MKKSLTVRWLREVPFRFLSQDSCLLTLSFFESIFVVDVVEVAEPDFNATATVLYQYFLDYTVSYSHAHLRDCCCNFFFNMLDRFID